MRWLRGATTIALVSCAMARADEPLGWKPDRAAHYLDERQKAWFAFDGRGEAATRSTCVSCHTVLPYILGRPALRKLAATAEPTEAETRLLAQTRMRVENWQQLDTKAFGLFYDATDQKKSESWGTEAVFNAFILALDDRNQGRASPSEATKLAFTHLWAKQSQAGEHAGTWDWLDFSEPPWGTKEARYFGAALAAIAVGTAPGYYTPAADRRTDASVQLLGDYLRAGLDQQNLHDQAWALWASAVVQGLLTQDQREKLVGRLVDKQREDGGWSLSSLGSWVRNDGTGQETASDGYATGLAIHVLQTAGVPPTSEAVARGLDWLRTNQTPAGDWRSVSVVKQRDADSHVGKFMSDAATAFAALALSDHRSPSAQRRDPGAR